MQAAAAGRERPLRPLPASPRRGRRAAPGRATATACVAPGDSAPRGSPQPKIPVLAEGRVPLPSRSPPASWVGSAAARPAGCSRPRRRGAGGHRRAGSSSPVGRDTGVPRAKPKIASKATAGGGLERPRAPAPAAARGGSSSLGQWSGRDRASQGQGRLPGRAYARGIRVTERFRGEPRCWVPSDKPPLPTSQECTGATGSFRAS